MKSNASELLKIAEAIYIDACSKCIAKVSDFRDLMTIRARVKEEGVSFLTITLPGFAKDLEKALHLGYIDSIDFRRFRKFKRIPAFLRGFTSLIFDSETGRIYDEQSSSFSGDCSVIIDSIRQICLAFEKIELTCTPSRVQAALENFVTIEHAFEQFSPPQEMLDEFRQVSACVWDNIIGRLDLNNVVPRHGPGATSDRITGNQKYVWRTWHERLEPYFPFIGNAYTMGVVNDLEVVENVTFSMPELELPVRVITVPKTLKGPRIIAIEPCCMQYAQQAIRHLLYTVIESAEISEGQVNFTSQWVNQQLALMSSKTGLLATIDLSDASDRVPRDLALEMFRSNPDIRDAIDACRSTSARMPNGDLISPLSKFASMGSALCFPVESMYFYTICIAALLRGQNLPVSQANALRVSRGIYVYGDDLIVPASLAMTVLDYLQKYNCKVNTRKTFVTGRFRESCGVDAYMGELVTPVRLRKDVPKNRRQVQELISWVATANLFYKKGYWQTTQLMRHTCEKILGNLPYVSDESEALGWVSFLGYRSAKRWNRKLQRLEIKAWSPRPVYRSDSIDGYPALMKCLSSGLPSTSIGLDDKEIDPLHLERIALHDAVALQRRWVPA